MDRHGDDAETVLRVVPLTTTPPPASRARLRRPMLPVPSAATS
jgi:hypothetical protein